MNSPTRPDYVNFAVGAAGKTRQIWFKLTLSEELDEGQFAEFLPLLSRHIEKFNEEMDLTVRVRLEEVKSVFTARNFIPPPPPPRRSSLRNFPLQEIPPPPPPRYSSLRNFSYPVSSISRSHSAPSISCRQKIPSVAPFPSVSSLLSMRASKPRPISPSRSVPSLSRLVRLPTILEASEASSDARSDSPSSLPSHTPSCVKKFSKGLRAKFKPVDCSSI